MELYYIILYYILYYVLYYIIILISPLFKDDHIILSTVEPLKEDPPIMGQCIIYLSTLDKTKSPNFIPPINIMRLEPLKEDNFYTGENPLNHLVMTGSGKRYTIAHNNYYKNRVIGTTG